MIRLFSLIIAAILIATFQAAPTIKYSTGCSVEECSPSQNGGQSNQSCSDTIKCYRFSTTRNTTICAPQVTCSVLESCINNSRTCATNTSVCVTNSCCDRPICVPLALTQTCTGFSTSGSSSVSGGICRNASWDSNAVAVTTNYINGVYIYLSDFQIDRQNNIIAVDSYNRRIIRMDMYNSTNITVLVSMSNTISSSIGYMALDTNGSAFITESYYSYITYQNFYQINSYRLNGETNSSGTVVYGPFTCGTGLSELCGANGFVRDSLGSLYYSDSQNHRVLKIQPFATSATVVAGVSGTSGSALNQLNSPGALGLDNANNLYVSDYGNNRLLKFTSGSTTGTVLLTTSMYQGVSGLLVESGGSVFASSSGNLLRWLPELNGFITVMALPSSYSSSRIRMDSEGNIYYHYSSGSFSIYRYKLLSNSC